MSGNRPRRKPKWLRRQLREERRKRIEAEVERQRTQMQLPIDGPTHITYLDDVRGER